MHFTNVTVSASAPDVDRVFRIAEKDDVVLQIDTKTDTNHTSTDYTLKAITSIGTTIAGTTDLYDEVISAYDVWAFEAVDIVRTVKMRPGPDMIKLRVENNDSNTRVDMFVKVYARW